jgi:hypothetical protein
LKVGQRVEQLADAGEAVPATGDHAVEVVAGTGRHQQQDGLAVLLGDQRPVQEQRHAGEPQHGQHVRDRPDAAGQLVRR